MSFTDLPAVNACLNSLSAVLLTLGWIQIRRGNAEIHKRFMLSACASSALFLTSYLIYHYQVGSVGFQGQGKIRVLYFAILISHTTLAVAIVPLVLLTLRHAFKQRLDRHKRIARWTLPLWLYVSVTGVVIYWMLYHGDHA